MVCVVVNLERMKKIMEQKHLEIEKKFLVRELPENLEQYPKKVMEQGYLCSNPVVRIRRSNEDYILTYKSRFGLEDTDENVKICNELEAPLNKEGYEHLREKTDGNLIKKTRYMIPLEQAEHPLTAELDVFEGDLSGLIVVEVEFPAPEDADKFQKPDWFGEDVSGDIRYTNNYLAAHGHD